MIHFLRAIRRRIISHATKSSFVPSFFHLSARFHRAHVRARHLPAPALIGRNFFPRAATRSRKRSSRNIRSAIRSISVERNNSRPVLVRFTGIGPRSPYVSRDKRPSDPASMGQKTRVNRRISMRAPGRFTSGNRPCVLMKVSRLLFRAVRRERIQRWSRWRWCVIRINSVYRETVTRTKRHGGLHFGKNCPATNYRESDHACIR